MSKEAKKTPSVFADAFRKENGFTLPPQGTGLSSDKRDAHPEPYHGRDERGNGARVEDDRTSEELDSLTTYFFGWMPFTK